MNRGKFLGAEVRSSAAGPNKIHDGKTAERAREGPDRVQGGLLGPLIVAADVLRGHAFVGRRNKKGSVVWLVKFRERDQDGRGINF